MKIRNLIIACVALAMPVGAARADERATEAVVVPYGELDLDSAAGATVMLNRLERAAERACGGRAGFAPLEFKMRFRRCRAMALADAVLRLDHPVVSLAYARAHPGAPQRLAGRPRPTA